MSKAIVEHPSLLTLVIIYVALMILLALTTGVAQLDLGALGLLIALAIAFAKALLVVLVFMHVKYASRVTWVFAGVALVWIGIMFSLTFSDYLMRPYAPRADDITENRSIVPAPEGVPRAEPMGPRVQVLEHGR